MDNPTPEVQQSTQPPINRSPVSINRILLIIVSVILLIMLVGGAYLLGTKNNQQSSGQLAETKPTPTPLPSKVLTKEGDITANWKTYTNKLWGYSIKYPQDQLVACTPTDEGGLRLWTIPFDCPVAHDAFYEIGIIGYKNGEYKQYKKPVSTNEITTNGIKSTKNIYRYENEDGPLQAFGGSIEILIPTKEGVIQIQLLGDDINKKNRFDQILSTFKFTN